MTKTDSKRKRAGPDAEANLSGSDLTLFLCGDVMTGRGIDQILARPSDPELYESFVKDAREYVELAERSSGRIPRNVEQDYIWGDALAELGRRRPGARIINLETSITTSDQRLPKGINYRMHPDNVPCLTAAGVDCCVLANNHVLDWGHAGLEQTLHALHAAGIRTAGAGNDHEQAARPATVEIAAPKTRVLIFAFATQSAGVPPSWAARPGRAGVHWLADLSNDTVQRIAKLVAVFQQTDDVVVASIHWGGNWGYTVPPAHRRFAQRLIDEAGVDIVHGHSSHHPMAIEVHQGKLILYGCGDFLNDYEGISGYEAYRGDLTLMYFPSLAVPSGRLRQLTLTPLQIRRFRLHHASADDARWMQSVLDRESAEFGARVTLQPGGTLALRWD